MSRFEDLLVKCKRCDSKAMMELYNICAIPVYNASLHIVMNEFDAEEIMQDSILKAFDNIDRFLGTEKDFIAFVKKIAVNKSIDWFRKNSKTPLFTEVGNNVVDLCDDDDDESVFSVDMIKEKAKDNPNYRSIIMLDNIEVDDESYTDIESARNFIELELEHYMKINNISTREARRKSFVIRAIVFEATLLLERGDLENTPENFDFIRYCNHIRPCYFRLPGW